MYEKYFGLSSKPFELLPNPRFLFMSKGHKKALSYLRYGLQERAGFTLLTGEVGSGKTTLLRDIIKNVRKETSLALIYNTKVSGVQLLAMVNEEFGLHGEGMDKVTLLRDLNDFLIAECSAGRSPILIIDEAQNLTADALEEVRLLSNLESDSFKLMQIIMVGQPELKDVIAKPELRQLRQRISVSCHLSPLNREEMESYIYHRLEVAGNRSAVSFQDAALKKIFDFSQGVPRLINLICDSLLLAAFVEETKEITSHLVEEASEELSLLESIGPQVELESVSDKMSPLKNRIDVIEAQFTQLNLAKAERESMLERLSSQGSILEYLIGQQQKQFNQFEESLKEITRQLDKLRDMLVSQSEQGVVRFGLRKKNS